MATSKKPGQSQRVRVSGKGNVTYVAGGDISVNPGLAEDSTSGDRVASTRNESNPHSPDGFDDRQRSSGNSSMQGQFDVFLCHNSEDKPAVKAIAARLEAEGLYPWLDEWALRPGFSWQRSLEEQIEKIHSAAVFVGPTGIGPWQQEELYAFLRAFVRRRCPVIPVILPGVAQEPDLPIFLEGLTWVDFRLNEPDPLRRLIWGITGSR